MLIFGLCRFSMLSMVHSHALVMNHVNNNEEPVNKIEVKRHLQMQENNTANSEDGPILEPEKITLKNPEETTFKKGQKVETLFFYC